MTLARVSALFACGALSLASSFVVASCGDTGTAASPGHHPVAPVGDGAVAAIEGGLDGGSDATSDGAGDALAIEAGPGITARGAHSCSIRNGTAKCWGANFYGELGNGTHSDGTPSPTPTTVVGVTDFVVHGLHHACGLTGAVTRCWGANDNDQLGHDQALENAADDAGDGSAGIWFGRPSTSAPSTVPGLNGAVDLALGSAYSCALAHGTVSCWGSDVSGVLGRTPPDGGTVCLGGPCLATPHAIPGLAGASQISAAEDPTACALEPVDGSPDETVWCWGDNGHGLLGQSAADGGAIVDTNPHPTPVQVPGLTRVKQVASGDTFRCALLSDGTVSCWGYNFSGQLGRAPTTDPGCTVIACNEAPAPVAGLANVSEIGLGEGFGCALRTDGTVLCWGQNGAGQLGRDPAGDAGDAGVANYVPQPVAGLSNVAHIAVGAAHACALESDESVLCWGDNRSGELGPGAVDASSIFAPVPVTGL